MAAATTPPEGRGPALVTRARGGKREGMVQPITTMGLVGESPTGALSEGAVAKTDAVPGRPDAVQARWSAPACEARAKNGAVA